MQTGILGGFITGGVVSALVLGAVSVVTYPVQTPPEATAIDVPAGSEFNQSREDTQASLPAGDASPEAVVTAPVSAPEPDDLSSLQSADTAPAQAPETGAAEGALTAPETSGGAPDVALDGDEPVLPSPQALPPRAPEEEGDLSISTEPAQPLQPEIDVSESAFDADTGVTQDPIAVPEPEQEPNVEVSTQPEPGAVSEPDAAPEVAPEPEAAALPEAEAEVETEAEVAPAPEDTGQNEQIAALPQQPDAPEQPSSTIGDLAEGVTTGRLPSVGDQEQAAAAPEEEAVEEVPQDLPRLQAYASHFENPAEKPLMAIILIDEGNSPISLDALADFPYPISYAVDASWSGARDAAQKYRDAGLEVLAMIDLAENASATDTEVAMQAYLSVVPEAVAIMEGTGSGLQASRAATQQLIPILQDSGHGLVLFSNGLNTAQKLIAREGVPALPVFRDFDSKDQDAKVIRRFLDQAAFRAGQEEVGVIMVGRLRAETVSALLLWGLQDRANSVAIAPVSALLRAQIEP